MQGAVLYGPRDLRVVGDGAVGLLGVLSARQMGAERIMGSPQKTDNRARLGIPSPASLR
jgi:threonine dehydrogenase-like Zn-dependent dehydrogenase